MLQINDITKLYGLNQGIQNVSFQLNKGEVCAIIGHNGSGKSTLFKSLLGLIQLDSGKILFDEKPIQTLMMGYLPENRSVIQDLKTTDLIELVAKLKRLNNEELVLMRDYWMKVLDCESLKSKQLKQCSKGNQQKIQLICALIHSPKVVILDEPFSGLDIEITRLFQKVITKLKKQGKIVLLSSHRFEEIEHLCDYICVIKESRVIMQGTLMDIKEKVNKQTVTLSNDASVFYKDEKGVVDIIRDGNLTHYIFENEKLCARASKAMITERGLKSIKISSLTLDDLFEQS